MKDQAKLLRWLADELEAGRAKVDLKVDLETEVYEEPRSWNTPHLAPVKKFRRLGSTWTINARTIETPEVPE